MNFFLERINDVDKSRHFFDFNDAFCGDSCFRGMLGLNGGFPLGIDFVGDSILFILIFGVFSGDSSFELLLKLNGDSFKLLLEVSVLSLM